MKTIIIVGFLSFSIITLLLNAQFKEGYIISNTNDTTYGFLDFEGSIQNSRHCTFKKELDGTAITYYPKDIQAFRFVDSKYFESIEILVDSIPQLVFMEWLILGRASILSYSKSGAVVKYYLKLDDGNLYELKNTKEIVQKKTTTSATASYEIEKKEYRGILMYYLKDCPSLRSNIEYTDLSGNSLIKIAKEYHEKTCEPGEECIIFENKSRKILVDIGLVLSLINSKFNLNNGIPENVNNAIAPGYGLSFSFSNLPIISPNFFLRTGISYYKILYTYDNEIINGYYIEEDRVCEIQYFRIPFQIGYKLRNKKFNPYISLGAILNLRFSYEQYNDMLMSYLTKHIMFDIGISPVQFGADCSLGFDYIITSKIGLGFNASYEFAGNFFGSWVSDKSKTYNLIFQTSIFFRL